MDNMVPVPGKKTRDANVKRRGKPTTEINAVLEKLKAQSSPDTVAIHCKLAHLSNLAFPGRKRF